MDLWLWNITLHKSTHSICIRTVICYTIIIVIIIIVKCKTSYVALYNWVSYSKISVRQFDVFRLVSRIHNIVKL